MQCRQAKAKISAYMDHELDAVSSRLVESHLHQCAECREALNNFQELDDMVRGLPRFDLGPDFAKQMVMKASGLAAAEKAGRTDSLSLLGRLSQIVEDFVDLVSSARSPSTGTLDEFGDFPPLSMGYIYFRLMEVPGRG
jgi:anti-sigma factor RsiW